jgi:ATPase subunit of ABC transporter with duplicated ATPase domains
MAVLLDIKNASKRYGDQVLLDRASATITDDGKIGFVGRNGAGKSTLLRRSSGIPGCGSAISGSTIRSCPARARSSF